ncbi:MAG TPA: GntR family transcriptional regulator [Thermoanaerobaculia bacterium]|nr:GntR family transcriptional regulator [Thermoanaerobaculia bacterium]
MLKVALSRTEPLSIHLQVGEQLRHQIEDGTLAPGSRLPTVRDLAAELGINYNTVRNVYTELERDGYISSEQGRGTFVKQRPPRVDGTSAQLVREMVDEALARAIMGGISAGEFARMTYTRAKMFRRRRKVRVLFAECNETELKQFGGEIAAAIGGAPDLVLIDALRKKKRAFFDDYDVLVTTLPHLQELAGLHPNVVGMTLEPDYNGVIASIFSLPAKTKIGLVGTDHMLQALQAAGLRDYTYVAADAKSLHRLKGVRRTYVSRRFEAEHGTEGLPGDVLPFDVHVTGASLRYLRQRLAEHAAG